MILILLFPILGFLAGLIYIIRKRKISPKGILIVTFQGLVVDKLRKYFNK